MAKSRQVQRTPAQIERDRAEIKRLGLQGKRQTEIYKLLNGERSVRERGYRISHSILREDHDAIIQGMRQEAIRHYDTYVKRQMKEIDKEERQYWQLWDESKKGGQLGNPKYLKGIQRCIERRCKLLGLYVKEPKQTTRKRR